MNRRFHRPPEAWSGRTDAPLVFLAGPIQGAPDWQKEAAKSLLTRRADIEVASPRRESEEGFSYHDQVAWEKRGLRRSAELGAVAFWFAGRDFSIPYEEGRSYAQTSRIEVGRVFGWHDFHPFPVAVGFDPLYTQNGGGSQRYVEAMCEEKDIPVARSLDELVEQIVAIAPTTEAT